MDAKATTLAPNAYPGSGQHIPLVLDDVDAGTFAYACHDTDRRMGSLPRRASPTERGANRLIAVFLDIGRARRWDKGSECSSPQVGVTRLVRVERHRHGFLVFQVDTFPRWCQAMRGTLIVA